MKLAALESAIAGHTGTFLCERINRRDETREVTFRHEITPPGPTPTLPDIGGLRDFYETFGSVTFYVDPVSGDAAKHIAPPDTWAELDDDLQDWFDGLGDDERDEILPEWFDDRLVIGEEPHTGNYLIMAGASAGDEAGSVHLFDHDGYEFIRLAASLPEYAERLLDPDDAMLVDIATHMRFIDGDPMVQWWIREMRDNRGNVASTAN
jgi:hypothetical protein